METVLCRTVMMVMMAVMMMAGSEGRTGKDEHKENGSENLLHAPECNTSVVAETGKPVSESCVERALRTGDARKGSVNYSYDEQSGTFPSIEPQTLLF